MLLRVSIVLSFSIAPSQRETRCDPKAVEVTFGSFRNMPLAD
jgi:hypothetical protein